VTVDIVPLLPFLVAGMLLAVARPTMGILLPIVFHPLTLVRLSIGPLPTTALELLILSVVAGVWLGTLNARTPQGGNRQQISPFSGLCIALFLLAATVSVFVSPHLRGSGGVWKAMIVDPILFALTLSTLLRNDRGLLRKRVILALVLGGLVSLGASVVVGGVGRDFGRFRGIYDVPNSLALVLAPLTTLSVVVGVLTPSLRFRLLARGVAGVFAVGLLLTQSLAGLLAVIVAVLIGGSLIGGPRKTILFLALLLAVAGFSWQWQSGKLSHMFQPVSSSIVARQEIWRVSWALIEEHPALGTGLGTFEPAYQQKLAELLKKESGVFPLEWVVRDPHNIVLSFWLHTGLLGLGAMGALSAVAFRRWFLAARSWRRGFRSDTTLVALSMGGGFLTLLLFGAFDVPYWKNDLALLWWVYLLVSITRGKLSPASLSPLKPDRLLNFGSSSCVNCELIVFRSTHAMSARRSPMIERWMISFPLCAIAALPAETKYAYAPMPM
jgi:O-antigen ligase